MLTDCFEIFSVPTDGIDTSLFVASMGKNPFLFIHDCKMDKTYLKILNFDYKNDIELEYFNSCNKGIKLLPSQLDCDEELFLISFYRGDGGRYGVIRDILSKKSDSHIMVLFMPQSQKQVFEFKAIIEKELSSRHTRSTRSYSGGIGIWKETHSLQNDIYSDSEERKILLSLINDIDQSIIIGSQLYKIFMLLNPNDKNSLDILEERSRIFSKERVKLNAINDLLKFTEKPGIIYGSAYAASMVEFLGPSRLSYTIDTFFPRSSGNIKIGNYLKDGAIFTNKLVSMHDAAFNLGTIISGLPGMGKTTALMNIIDQIMINNQKIGKRTLVAILSPTSEWDNFGNSHNMNVLRFNDSTMQINFFMPPRILAYEKFYQDLALLLSSASNSGPYQGPIEKCMLNAFRHVYTGNNTLNPTHIYNHIEESIIKLHGKITNVGIKYTKHGENIHASLENLRAIISKEEYSVTKGISIERLLEKGIIFSMENVSNNMRPYIYALILNQLYSITEHFDVFGDNELRMLICIEEAQTIFKNEQKKTNAATQDLINRIQNFRKKGIGIVLLVHSITDIDSNIRRLCQNKIYMKQPSDISPIASKELVFTYSDNDKITNKLKHLDSSIAAFDFVGKNDNERVSNDSVFVKILHYEDKNVSIQKITPRKQSAVIISEIYLFDSRSKVQKEVSKIRVNYLGEEIYTINVENNLPIKLKLFDGRYYLFELLSEAKRILYRLEVCALLQININISDNGAIQLNIQEKNTSK